VDNADEILALIRRVRRPDQPADPAVLGRLAELDTTQARLDAGRLLAGIPVDRIAPDGYRPRPLRVAIAATFTAEGVAPLLRVQLLQDGIAPQMHVCGFDQLVVQLSDPDSELARFQPDVTLCLLHDHAFLPREWDPTDLSGLKDTLAGRVSMLEHAVRGFADRSAGAVVLHTVALSATEYRKVIGLAGRAGLGRIWRELNLHLLDLADRHASVHVIDFETVLVDEPAPVRDERLYRFASMAWTPAAEASYVREAAAFCRAATGLAKKLLVVDLDNTLWGGVLGDDGVDGILVGGGYPGNCYTELQRGLVALRQQGVLLAYCSKNEQSTVDDAFARHPELTLRSADFVARVANWGRKDHNIRQIVEALNLGLGSVVFVDDSAFECDLVGREIPQVRTVRLSGDPAGHLSDVLAAGHFDVLATTSTDRERTAMYQARSDRQQFAASFTSAADYLTGLDLRVTVAAADEFSLPRLVQLGLRTNQFNMTGQAHPEARTREMASSPEHLVLGFEVEDRFGREGHVGAVWVSRHPDHWLIENFVMSCRVFSRGVEHAVLSYLIDEAGDAGVRTLQALYRPGERNRAAAALYPDAGFARLAETDGLVRYALDLSSRPSIRPEWIVLNRKEHAAHV
jgi:FkbH-like protein